MGAEADEFYYAGFFVPPYQQCVALYVALHVAFVIAGQHVWTVFLRDGEAVDEQTEDFFKFVNQPGFVFIAFKVSLKLRCQFKSMFTFKPN